MDLIVNTLSTINRNNIYTKFIQKDDLNEKEIPTRRDIELNTVKYTGRREGGIFMRQDDYMFTYDYNRFYDADFFYTLYTPDETSSNKPDKKQLTCVLYVPGFGRNFTIMNLNNVYRQNGMDLVGIDLPNYGYSYRQKKENVNYNTIDTSDNTDNYFLALNIAIKRLKSPLHGYTKVILMGNGTGGLICANYVTIAPTSYVRPDFLVLESPSIEFKEGGSPIPNSEFPIPANIMNQISPVLYSLMPDLIIYRDGDDPDWLRKKPFYIEQMNRSKTLPVENYGYVDYYYNPLSNRPVYVSYIQYVSKLCNNIASITTKTKIPILLLCISGPDTHINIPVVKQRVQNITETYDVFTSDSTQDEIMLDTWANITACIGQIKAIIDSRR